ncbi:hypothetical protein LWI29_009903 [Acer saccharum]|uniref:Uncharacterized protein n=1 Tax=Acer saccharum TaxID=4024 RepID=A0AA39TD87_ACESA|nr:hypothetical protein LWI29_009903 [Acer saccharum]
MFTNRKERAELLEGPVISNTDQTIPNFPQNTIVLYHVFNTVTPNYRQLGDNATFQGIEKGGHLVHLERPCVYNRRLKQFLASLHADISEK